MYNSALQAVLPLKSTATTLVRSSSGGGVEVHESLWHAPPPTVRLLTLEGGNNIASVSVRNAAVPIIHALFWLQCSGPECREYCTHLLVRFNTVQAGGVSQSCPSMPMTFPSAVAVSSMSGTPWNALFYVWKRPKANCLHHSTVPGSAPMVQTLLIHKGFQNVIGSLRWPFDGQIFPRKPCWLKVG